MISDDLNCNCRKIVSFLFQTRNKTSIVDDSKKRLQKIIQTNDDKSIVQSKILPSTDRQFIESCEKYHKYETSCYH